MNGAELVRLVTNALFLVVFVGALRTALRERSRTSTDASILFGALAVVSFPKPQNGPVSPRGSSRFCLKRTDELVQRRVGCHVRINGNSPRLSKRFLGLTTRLISAPTFRLSVLAPFSKRPSVALSSPFF